MAIQLPFFSGEMLLQKFVLNSTQHPCVVVINFFSKRFARFPVVQPYGSYDTATAWKNRYFISSERTDFSMIDSLPMADASLCIRILKSLSLDEILIPMNVYIYIYMPVFLYNSIVWWLFVFKLIS